MSLNGRGFVLSTEELLSYTGKTRPSAQARVLTAWGIPYRRRPDGSLAVLRLHVEEQALGLEDESAARAFCADRSNSQALGIGAGSLARLRAVTAVPEPEVQP